MPIPEVIPIRLMEDLQTEYVGQCGNGDQFFLAHHRLHSAEDLRYQDYLALYRFDRAGKAKNATVRPIADPEEEEEVTSLLLRQLGEYRLHDILVRPFQFEQYGLTFGLIPDHEEGTLTLQPGAMITFMEPWDGEYCT